MQAPVATTENPTEQQEHVTRKPYEKPQVIYRAPLEAMAALCGTPQTGKSVSGGGGVCSVTFS